MPDLSTARGGEHGLSQGRGIPSRIAARRCPGAKCPFAPDCAAAKVLPPEGGICSFAARDGVAIARALDAADVADVARAPIGGAGLLVGRLLRWAAGSSAELRLDGPGGEGANRLLSQGRGWLRTFLGALRDAGILRPGAKKTVTVAVPEVVAEVRAARAAEGESKDEKEPTD